MEANRRAIAHLSILICLGRLNEKTCFCLYNILKNIYGTMRFLPHANF